MDCASQSLTWLCWDEAWEYFNTEMGLALSGRQVVFTPQCSGVLELDMLIGIIKTPLSLALHS